MYGTYTDQPLRTWERYGKRGDQNFGANGILGIQTPFKSGIVTATLHPAKADQDSSDTAWYGTQAWSDIYNITLFGGVLVVNFRCWLGNANPSGSPSFVARVTGW